MYARMQIGCVVSVECVVGMMHNTGIFETEVRTVIGICKMLANVSTIRSPAHP